MRNLGHSAYVLISSIVLIANFSSTPVSARVYDWVTLGRDDIQVVISSRVEAQLRLEMVRSAKTSLDIATFDQRPDDVVGVPFLDALEEAALKGVEVRYALNEMILPLMDSKGYVKSRLKEIAARTNKFHYIFAGGTPMEERGFHRFDGIHEKLIVVDKKLAATSGRGHGEVYLSWLDTGFIFKGNLAVQSAEAFEVFWQTLNSECPVQVATEKKTQSEVSPPSQLDPENTSLPPGSLQLKMSPTEVLQVTTVSEWLKKPSTGGTDYRARILHYDFLNQMRNLPNVQAGKKAPNDYTLDNRIDMLSDPVVNEVLELLPTASSMKFNILTVILHPRINLALDSKLASSSVEDPFSLEIFTNSKHSNENVTPLHFAIGWYAGIENLDNLLQYKNTSVYLLKKNLDADDPVFTHRKLIIIRQNPNRSKREDSVIFGSHNLSYSSSTTLDEMSFQIESNEFASKMTKLYDESLITNAYPADKTKTHLDLLNNRFKEAFDELFKFMF